MHDNLQLFDNRQLVDRSVLLSSDHLPFRFWPLLIELTYSTVCYMNVLKYIRIPITIYLDS